MIPPKPVPGRLEFLWGYARRYPGYWCAGLLSLFLAAAFAGLVPYQVKRGVELLARPNRVALIKPLALYVTLIAIAEWFFTVMSRIVVYRAAREIEYELRNDLFRHLLGLPQSFYDRTPSGEVLSRSANDTSDLRLMFGAGFINILSTGFHLLVALGMMLAISPRLTFAVLPLVPVLAALFRWLSARNYANSEQCQEDLAAISTRVTESLAGHATVLAHGQEEAEKARFAVLNERFRDDSIKEARLRTLTWPMIGFLAGAGVVVLIAYGGTLVAAGELTVGDFVAFHGYLALLIWPLVGFGWILNVVQRGMAALDRVLALLRVGSDVADRPGARPAPERLERGIEIRNLTFAYPRRGLRDMTGDGELPEGVEPGAEDRPPEPVLRDVSLTIRPGETVAIAGRIGSGKSTLVELLARLYPVPDGTIFVDGVDLNQLEGDGWRARLGVVARDKFLFSDTLRANLAAGRPDLDDARIRHFATMSGLDKDVVEFPDGYDTLLGERGITLSGGQRQRACLARALAREPILTILDDGFSAVDTHTEEEILAALAAREPKGTTVLVSHRPSTIREADRIVVLERGRVAEEGTHEELIRRGGVYRDLIEKAALREELGLSEHEAVLS